MDQKDKDKIEALLESFKEYKLKKPVTVADKTFDVLHLDFEGIKGKDLEAISSLKGCNNGDMGMNEYSKTYLAHVAALAAGITVHELREFSGADYTALTMAAQAFLMSAGSSAIEK